MYQRLHEEQQGSYVEKYPSTADSCQLVTRVLHSDSPKRRMFFTLFHLLNAAGVSEWLQLRLSVWFWLCWACSQGSGTVGVSGGLDPPAKLPHGLVIVVKPSDQNVMPDERSI